MASQHSNLYICPSSELLTEIFILYKALDSTIYIDIHVYIWRKEISWNSHKENEGNRIIDFIGNDDFYG